MFLTEKTKYSIFDTSSWDPVGVEQSGTNKPTWLVEPDSQELWLFKECGSSNPALHGKAWAEVSVYEIGQLLGVPCAETHLATRGNKYGSISKNFIGTNEEFISGSELIIEQIRDFDARDKKRRHHNLNVIAFVLADASVPIDESNLWMNALDYFVGYLVLDALTASGDRHVENWGVLDNRESRRLARSWDHGNSLGFNLLDSIRDAFLQSGIEKYAIKGRPNKFEAGGPLTLMDLAISGLQMLDGRSRDYWFHQVASLDREALRSILFEIPGMSDLERRFAFELVLVNQRRMLHEQIN